MTQRSLLKAKSVLSNNVAPGRLAELAENLASRNPVPWLMPLLARAWPVMDRWSLHDGLAGLRSDLGDDRVVEVELGPRGRGYMDRRYSRVSMPFGMFLDAFILDRVPSSNPRSQLPVGYLAQHDLATTVDNLARQLRGGSVGDKDDDLDDPLAFAQCGPRKEFWRRTLWVGPRGSFTPFHKDPYIGIYTQVVGRKRFHLVPPALSDHLAISPHPPHTNTSTIPVSVSTIAAAYHAGEGGLDSSGRADTAQDVLSAAMPIARNECDPDQDLSDIPPETMAHYATQLERAFREPGSCTADLGPGDSLLIPEGWFHSAEGLEAGVGVNTWFR